MARLTRRDALLSAALVSTLPLLLDSKKAAAQGKTPRPLVHVTDLFRPHNDPDDHWDLATSYALAFRDALDLVAVLADNPENIEKLPELKKALADAMDSGVYATRNPDVAAVAQLNYITGKEVPVTTGTIWPGIPGEKVREDNLPKELRGVNMLLDILKRSSQPVAILTAGSCQDVAIAGRTEPRLFEEKCAGIYLNAGVSSQKPKEQWEWNVSLNSGAYATMFELPCPIYWMPAYHALTKTGIVSGEYGTYFSFQQKEILPHLSDRLQAFFAYMLSKESGTNWLSYLLDPANKNSAQKYFDDERGMCCTAGFLHAAGKIVTSDGEIVSLQTANEAAAFEFVPIEVRCNADGITDWRKAKKATNRWIFRVRDTTKYREAMVTALKSILVQIP